MRTADPDTIRRNCSWTKIKLKKAHVVQPRNTFLATLQNLMSIKILNTFF